MQEEGLSRKQKLALWRARKVGGQSGEGLPCSAEKHAKIERSVAAYKSQGGHGGVLAARPGAENGVRRPAARTFKDGIKRKPFQVRTR